MIETWTSGAGRPSFRRAVREPPAEASPGPAETAADELVRPIQRERARYDEEPAQRRRPVARQQPVEVYVRPRRAPPRAEVAAPPGATTSRSSASSTKATAADGGGHKMAARPHRRPRRTVLALGGAARYINRNFPSELTPVMPGLAPTAVLARRK